MNTGRSISSSLEVQHANRQEATRSARARRLRWRAFTLIEIMITMAIMAIVLMTGLPPFVRAMRKEGMRKAVDDVFEACKHARADAIIQGRPATVVFHPVDGTFSAPKFSSSIPQDISILSIGVNFMELGHAEQAKVTFYPNGISDEFEITLQGPNGDLKQVYLDIITGTPQLKDPRYDR